MKLIKKASKSVIKISKSEWLSIGKTAGWIRQRSEEELEKLEISKQEAIKIAEEIKAKLEEMGYQVPDVNIKDKVVIIGVIPTLTSSLNAGFSL